MIEKAIKLHSYTGIKFLIDESIERVFVFVHYYC